MRQTRQDGREELFGVLQTVEGVIAQKYVTQPNETGPVAQIDNHGLTWTREEWVWPVRIYVKANDPSAEEAQAILDQTVDALERACNIAGYGTRGDDQFVPNTSADQVLWQATVNVTVPREDF